MITISQLWTYPFKSGKGQSLNTTQFDAEGMCNDRRLVALDKNGVFLTARRYAELLQLSCTKTAKGWLLAHPSQSEPHEILLGSLTATVSGTLWKDSIKALDAGDEAAHWLSQILNTEVRIALWEKQSRHSNKYQFETTFSDASPILLTSEASIQTACQWGGIASDARRFRANLIVEGIEAFAEDSWRKFSIGGVEFEVLDTCVRCILTTRDPDSGERHPQRQPMAALTDNHSNSDGQPLFGVNVKPATGNNKLAVSVGDRVQLLD